MIIDAEVRGDVTYHIEAFIRSLCIEHGLKSKVPYHDLAVWIFNFLEKES